MELTGLVTATLCSAVAAVLVAEFKDWAPWLSERLRRRAVKSAPRPLRDRLDEEWAAHLCETPGNIGKLVCAANFVVAAHSLRAEVTSSALLTLLGLAWRWPTAICLFFVAWKNWRCVAKILRAQGHEIGWCALELTPSEFVEYCRSNRNQLFSDEITAVAKSLSENKTTLVLFTCLLVGQPNVAALRNIAHVDEGPFWIRFRVAFKVIRQLIKSPSNEYTHVRF